MSVDLRGEIDHVNKIADAIAEIDVAIKKLRAGPLTDKALILLIRNACPKSVSLVHVEEVLTGMARLKELYLKDE